MTDAGPAPSRLLVKASQLHGLPVVSITEGEALANVKDVVYSPDEGRLLGFTLNKRGGLFAGPMKAVLSMGAVVAIGRAAVMVQDGHALDDRLPQSSGTQHQVLHNHVLTETGDRLGEVSDLVVVVGVTGSTAVPSGGQGASVGDVVGYEIVADPRLQAPSGSPGQVTTAGESGGGPLRRFIPLPATLAVSGQNLVVPATVESFIRDDLSSFGGAVDAFRAQIDPGGAQR